MAFSRWYPVSSFYYDPTLQPTKPIAKLQANDETQMRKVPKGRYDTTYRREYLNFGNGMPSQTSRSVDKYSSNPNLAQSSNLNPYQVLPPINSPQSSNIQPTSIDHLISEPPSYLNQKVELVDQSMMAQNSGGGMSGGGMSGGGMDHEKDNYLPIDPIYLSPQEEQSLCNDVNRELAGYSTSQLKQFYNELTSYDPNLTGYTHHAYVSLVGMRNQLPLSEPLMRFVMSRFVSSSQERGFVNYEDLVKFLAKCIGGGGGGGGPAAAAKSYANAQQYQQQPQQAVPAQAYMQQTPYATYNQQGSMSPRRNQDQDGYDPDEQAILRLMHENMRDWDQVNLIDCDNLRKKFYEIDPYNRYILTQREIEDVIYKNRIPIQRSLIFQILEKYCKVATGQYRWPAFVDFLEKTYNLRMPNKKKTHYVLREDEKDQYASEYTYRTSQLESLRSKANEEERLEEINKQIYNLQNLKQETKMRIESRLDDVVQGESWFTRFMRLANAMYSHRVNAGIDFVLPKDEARRLVNAYNTVYELNIPEYNIEEGLNRCSQKGNVVIDDLLKVLSKVK